MPTNDKSSNLMTEEYESIVASCADNDSSMGISNRHISHAAILTKHIIRKSQSSVDILTGSLPELFFNQIKNHLADALKRGIVIRIVFVNDGKVCPNLLSMVQQNKKIQVYELTSAAKAAVKNQINHFCVSDNKRFRIEEIHPDKNFDTDPAISATANFNHPQEAKRLRELFDALIKFSNPVSA